MSHFKHNVVINLNQVDGLEIKFFASLKRNNHSCFWAFSSNRVWFYNVTYGSGVARRERRKRSNPGALSHAARAIIPRQNKIKPESRRALTLPISEDSTPTHPVPSSSIARPTPLPSFSPLGREERAEAWPLSSSQHPSPVPWECAEIENWSRRRESDSRSGEGREKKYELESRVPERARKYSSTDSVWESRSNRA